MHICNQYRYMQNVYIYIYSVSIVIFVTFIDIDIHVYIAFNITNGVSFIMVLKTNNYGLLTLRKKE